MVSDELRKKWGTIFMGEREASLEQIDAMQEPIFRERNRKEQEQAYFDRVKQKATERAKTILGEAYAERQKVLQEARTEAENAHAKLLEQARHIQLQAQEEKDAAAQELARAREIRLEAEQLKDLARDEGYHAGMAQANEELKAFRGEMGQGFATILQLVAHQIGSISETWREELVLLVQTAVTAATGWVLDSKHEAIMRTLVVEAVSLLEQREIITVRVNPQDEALVSDMFRAAREKAPEIRQWIVTADENIACGGLIAESGSGSVDCQREHFQELVDGILAHLALPEGEADIARVMKIHEATQAQAQQFMPQVEECPHVAPPVFGENVVEATLPPEEAALPPEVGGESPLPVAEAPDEDVSLAEPTCDTVAEHFPESMADDAMPAQGGFAPDVLPDDAAAGTARPVSEAQAMPDAVAMQPEMPGVPDDVPEAWLPPLGEEDEVDTRATEIPSSLSDLEDELFPLEDDKVLARGGFLPGGDAQAG